MPEIVSKNLGLIVKERRLAKNWSTLFCARRLKIKQEHLKAIEANNIDHLPTGPRLEKMLRDYLNLLGFSSSEVIAIADSWKSVDQGRRSNFFGRNLVRQRDLWSWPQLVRNGLIGLAIVVAAGYIIFSLKNIVAPPTLVITSPASDVATSQKQLWLVGQTEPEVQLDINGETLLSDRTGHFSQPINLRAGINNLSVTAIKKYGGQTTVVRQVMVSD